MIRLSRQLNLLGLNHLLGFNFWFRIQQCVSAFNHWQVSRQFRLNCVLCSSCFWTWVWMFTLLVLVIIRFAAALVVYRSLNHSIIAVQPYTAEWYIFLDCTQLSVFLSRHLRSTNCCAFIFNRSRGNHNLFIISAGRFIVKNSRGLLLCSLCHILSIVSFIFCFVLGINIISVPFRFVFASLRWMRIA